MRKEEETPRTGRSIIVRSATFRDHWQLVTNIRTDKKIAKYKTWT